MAEKTVRDQLQSNNWVGWIFFASVMLLLLGGLEVISGFAAIFSHTFYTTSTQQVLVLNYAAWGWIHVGIGLLLMATSSSLILGKTWARAVAITVALLSAFANIAYLPVYPVWSLISLTINGFVIYAITMHSVEIKG